NSLSGRVVTWASNAPSLASVSATGLVTGGAAGVATITATSEGKSGTAAITVTAPPPSSGPAVYVAPAGNNAVSCAQAQNIATPKQTLTNAIGCLTPGTTLLIRGGTYAPDPTTAAQHIRISNGEIKNAPVQGVLVTGPNTRFNEFINLKIHGNGGAVGSNNLNHGIYIEGPNNLVDNCDFYGNAAHGVQVYSSNGGANNNIVRNTKSHGNNKGMVIASGSGNVAYNNLIYGKPAEGLTVDYGGSKAAIYNNNFYNNGTGTYNGAGSANAL